METLFGLIESSATSFWGALLWACCLVNFTALSLVASCIEMSVSVISGVVTVCCFMFPVRVGIGIDRGPVCVISN